MIRVPTGWDSDHRHARAYLCRSAPRRPRDGPISYSNSVTTGNHNAGSTRARTARAQNASPRLPACLRYVTPVRDVSSSLATQGSFGKISKPETELWSSTAQAYYVSRESVVAVVTRLSRF